MLDRRYSRVEHGPRPVDVPCGAPSVRVPTVQVGSAVARRAVATATAESAIAAMVSAPANVATASRSVRACHHAAPVDRRGCHLPRTYRAIGARAGLPRGLGPARDRSGIITAAPLASGQAVRRLTLDQEIEGSKSFLASQQFERETAPGGTPRAVLFGPVPPAVPLSGPGGLLSAGEDPIHPSRGPLQHRASLCSEPG